MAAARGGHIDCLRLVLDRMTSSEFDQTVRDTHSCVVLHDNSAEKHIKNLDLIFILIMIIYVKLNCWCHDICCYRRLFSMDGRGAMNM